MSILILLFYHFFCIFTIDATTNIDYNQIVRSLFHGAQHNINVKSSIIASMHTILVPRAIQTHGATIATTLSSPACKPTWAKNFSTSRHNRNPTWATTQSPLGRHRHHATNLAISLFRYFAISLFRYFAISLFRYFAISPFRHLTISASGSRFVGAPQTLSKIRFRSAQTPYYVNIVKLEGNVNMFSDFFAFFLHFILLFYYFFTFSLLTPPQTLTIIRLWRVFFMRKTI